MPKTSDIRWKRQEKELQTRSGLKGTPASGAASVKGDAHGVEFCVQAKSTTKSSYRLSIAEIEQAQADAAREDRSMLFQIELGNGTRLAVLLWDELEALVPRL